MVYHFTDNAVNVSVFKVFISELCSTFVTSIVNIKTTKKKRYLNNIF